MRSAKGIAALCASALALFCAFGKAEAAQPHAKPTAKGAPRKFEVVAYLPEYRIQTISPSQLAYITDLIYFSIQPTPTGELDKTNVDAATLKKLHALKQSSHVKLFIALGGWERSNNFVPMSADKTIRAHFVQTLTKFCLDNKFDGVDYDWEHPHNKAEEEAYAALLIETRQAFHPHGLRLSIAMADWQQLSKEGLLAVDRIHVMAYDHDLRHSTFDQAKADVSKFTGKGVPAKNVLMGVPFYGRNIMKNDVEATYGEIVRKYHPAPDVDEVDGIYFNGIKTIQQKTQYALDNGLGGIMIWELGQDSLDNTSLVQAIHRLIHK